MNFGRTPFITIHYIHFNVFLPLFSPLWQSCKSSILSNIYSHLFLSVFTSISISLQHQPLSAVFTHLLVVFIISKTQPTRKYLCSSTGKVSLKEKILPSRVFNLVIPTHIVLDFVLLYLQKSLLCFFRFLPV